MITKEEYLKAKSIVDQYEQEEWEDAHRNTDDNDDDYEEEDECSLCGRDIRLTGHCSCRDPLAYENCGYG